MKNILCIEPSGKLYGSEMVLFDILSNKRDPNSSYKVTLPPNSPLLEYLQKSNINYSANLDINTNRINKVVSYCKLFFYIISKKIDLIFINQAGIIRPLAIFSNLTNIPIVCEVSTLEDAQWVNSLSPKYYKNVQTFICNSKFISEELKVQDNKKSTLYYGYQWKGLRPTPRADTTPFKIVLVGRISRSKGHFLLVEAIKLLLEKFELKIQVFFVGDAFDEGVEIELKNKIKACNLTHCFTFRGFCKNIEAELTDKNLMVIPSLREPFGRVFCEAAEAKLPVLISDSGGLGELSNHFKLGVSFKSNDPIDLVEKLYYIIQNYYKVRTEFLQNSGLILDQLDMGSYIQTIETIISEAIRGKAVSINWFGTPTYQTS